MPFLEMKYIRLTYYSANRNIVHHRVKDYCTSQNRNIVQQWKQEFCTTQKTGILYITSKMRNAPWAPWFNSPQASHLLFFVIPWPRVPKCMHWCKQLPNKYYDPYVSNTTNVCVSSIKLTFDFTLLQGVQKLVTQLWLMIVILYFILWHNPLNHLWRKGWEFFWCKTCHCAVKIILVLIRNKFSMIF